jgi:hypothetical protein
MEEITIGPPVDWKARGEAGLKRLQDAIQGFDTLNRTLPQGMAPMLPDLAEAEVKAQLNAVTNALIDAGLFTQDEIAARKVEEWADIVESGLQVAREHKRAQLGLLVPQGGIAKGVPPGPAPGHKGRR